MYFLAYPRPLRLRDLTRKKVPPSLYGFDFALPNLAERSRSRRYFN